MRENDGPLIAFCFSSHAFIFSYNINKCILKQCFWYKQWETFILPVSLPLLSHGDNQYGRYTDSMSYNFIFSTTWCISFITFRQKGVSSFLFIQFHKMLLPIAISCCSLWNCKLQTDYKTNISFHLHIHILYDITIKYQIDNAMLTGLQRKIKGKSL